MAIKSVKSVWWVGESMLGSLCRTPKS